jgi:Mannosyltransferase (PIG-V)
MIERGPSELKQARPLPAWARVADVVAALLALLGITIGLTGGFRTHIGPLPLTLTSPYRLLFEAAAITVVRHLVARDYPAYRYLLPRLAAWATSTPVRTAILVVIATRAAIFFVGYLAVVTIGYAQGARPFREFSTELLNLPLRWDAGWYLGIATRGYDFQPGDPALQQNIVFFPAYPMLVRIAALLLGKSFTAYVVGGTIASLGAFTAALAYLYRLAREDLTEEQTTAALWLIAAYPFSLFYGAIYTESLFLLSCVGAFYHLRRNQALKAGVFGFVAGLTRPNGFVLCAPLALFVLERARPWRRGAFSHRGRQWAAAAMPAAGALLYSIFIWRLTGNPLAWLSGHAAWGRHYGGLTQLVAGKYGYIVDAGVLEYVSNEPYDLLNALGVLFVLFAAWPVYRRFGMAYTAFILVTIVPPLAAGGLMSAGRFSSVLFPAFLALAANAPAQHRIGWISAFAVLQALNATLFYTWRPLF